MVQFLCYVTFWKSFHSGSEQFDSDTDPAAAGAAAGAAAASAAASAACIYYVIIGGALRAPLYVHGEIHTAEAAVEAAEAAASKSLLAIHSA